MYDLLKNYKNYKKELEHLELLLELDLSELERWKNVNDLGKVKLERESNASKIEERITLTNKKIKNIKSRLARIEEFISKCSDQDNAIIKEKYIHDKTLEAIAEEMNLPAQSVRRRHAELRRTMNMMNVAEM